jgi:hypothetical protein
MVAKHIRHCAWNSAQNPRDYTVDRDVRFQRRNHMLDLCQTVKFAKRKNWTSQANTRNNIWLGIFCGPEHASSPPRIIYQTRQNLTSKQKGNWLSHRSLRGRESAAAEPRGKGWASPSLESRLPHPIQLEYSRTERPNLGIACQTWELHRQSVIAIAADWSSLGEAIRLVTPHRPCLNGMDVQRR